MSDTHRNRERERERESEAISLVKDYFGFVLLCKRYLYVEARALLKTFGSTRCVPEDLQNTCC